jgi:hypothetical protein
MRKLFAIGAFCGALIGNAAAEAQNLTAQAPLTAAGPVSERTPVTAKDDFSVVNTTLNGKPVQPDGGYSWVQEAGGSGNTTNPRITNAGFLQVGQGAGAVFNTSVRINPAYAAPNQTVSYTLSPKYMATVTAISTNMPFPGDIVVITSGSSYATTYHWFAPTASQGSVQTHYSASGAFNAGRTGGTTGTFLASTGCPGCSHAYIGFWPGDTITIARRTSGASVYFDWYQNGWKVAQGATDFAALYAGSSLSMNGNVSVAGDAQTNTPDELSNFVLADPDTQATLVNTVGGHVCSLKIWDAGSSTNTVCRLSANYTGGAPPMVYVSLYNATTGALVQGPQPMQGYAAVPGMTRGAGAISGWMEFTAATAPTRYYILESRLDLPGGKNVSTQTPVMSSGVTYMISGQSLATRLVQGVNTVSQPSTIPAWGWTVDGSSDTSGGAGWPRSECTSPPAGCLGLTMDQRVNYDTATSCPACLSTNNATVLASGYAAASGLNAFSLIRNGFGGTLQASRDPGGKSFTYEASLQGIAHQGDVEVVGYNGGTYEIHQVTDVFGNVAPSFNYGSDTIAFKNQLIALRRAYEGVVGHPIMMVLTPPPALDDTAGTTVDDQRTMNLGRLEWELSVSDPTHFYFGGWCYECQHDGEIYHLTNAAIDGFAEFGRRMGWAAAKAAGLATCDRNGPSVNSVTRNNSSQITITVNLNCASNLSLDNAAAAATALGTPWSTIGGDYRFGMKFNSASTFASGTEINPTGASLANLTATTQDVVLTCSACFPSPTYVRMPWGANPYNPSNNATINTNKTTTAAMIRGVYPEAATWTAPPPLQVYYNPAYPTDNTHDYFIAN